MAISYIPKHRNQKGFFIFFSSLGVQNIWNPEMLAIFLSHIKIPI